MNKDYDGRAISPVYTITPYVEGLTASVKYSHYDSLNPDKTSSLLAPSKVGTYKAIFTIPETENYTSLKETVIFEIFKGNAYIQIDNS